MKTIFAFVLAVLLGLLLCACGAPPSDSGEDTRLTVGFSQMETTNPWRIAETIDIEDAAQTRNVLLVYRDGQSSVQKQVEDILEFVRLQVDYILLAPRKLSGYQQAFTAAKAAGIPIIVVDREVDGIPKEEYVTTITADFLKEGKLCAQKLYEKFGDKPCNIVEIAGTPGSSVARDRAQGFREEIEQYANMKIVVSQSGDFVRTTAQATMESILQQYRGRIDAVYAHDDDSGIGAIQAMKTAGIRVGKDVFVVSCAGQKDALKAIIAGELLASIECNPRIGARTFAVIEALERGESVPDRIIYTGIVYDATNAETLFDNAF